MKINKVTYFQIVLLSCCISIITSCSNMVSSEYDYIQWINKKENGCVKVKEVKNLKYTAKFLPADFLALRECEMGEVNKNKIDSVSALYANGVHIYFRIDPINEGAETDLMYADVYTKEEFIQRVYDMNFNLQSKFHIECNGNEISPELFHFENDYGMKTGKGIDLVFPLPENDSSSQLNFSLVFEDPVFYTGINKFRFTIDKSQFPKII